jgi:hypothetical protein
MTVLLVMALVAVQAEDQPAAGQALGQERLVRAIMVALVILITFRLAVAVALVLLVQMLLQE